MILTSTFSGCCDLYDQIYSIEASDDWKESSAFDRFKERTGGVIYQSIPIKINKLNIDMIIEAEKKKYGDKYDSNPNIVLRKADGGYYNHGKFFKTVNQLAKDGDYYLRKEIHFNKITDLVKYYPYPISVLASGSDKSLYVEIPEHSEVEMNRSSFYSHGINPSLLDDYDQKLKEEFIRLAREYE